MQETFINAWRGAVAYAGTGSARAWPYAIARNVARHQMRKRVGEPTNVESLEELAERAGWGTIQAVEPAPADSVALEILDECMQRLPPDERELLTLRELDGFSGEETAALLHLSVPAMKSRLRRARIHLASIVRARHPSQSRSAAHA